MKINQMSAHDLNDLASLCDHELVLDRYARSIPGILTRRPHIGLVATHGSMMMGACIGSVAPGNDGDTEGFTDLLVVDGAKQRQGIGRRLTKAMEQRLAARGCRRIGLMANGPHYTWPLDLPARARRVQLLKEMR
jgi:ribosomal protein S18 acetylase RimI-like enzyme